MPTSTRFVVAVHTLTGLAVGDGRPMRSEDIAYSVNTNAVVIRGLLSRLSESGLTKSQLGTGGGTLLAKPAAEIPSFFHYIGCLRAINVLLAVILLKHYNQP